MLYNCLYIDQNYNCWSVKKWGQNYISVTGFGEKWNAIVGTLKIKVLGYSACDNTYMGLTWRILAHHHITLNLCTQK